MLLESSFTSLSWGHIKCTNLVAVLHFLRVWGAATSPVAACVAVKCLGSHERIPKPEARRRKANRNSLNHPYSITFFRVWVKGVNRPKVSGKPYLPVMLEIF